MAEKEKKWLGSTKMAVGTWLTGLMLAACLLGETDCVQAAPRIASEAEEDKLLTVTRELTKEELDGLTEPQKDYWDKEGRLYQLLRWDVKEQTGELEVQHMEKQVVYEAVEGAERLPSSIPVTQSQDGGAAQGQLSIREKRVLREAWQEDFVLPVTFHAYGAQEYQLGSVIVGGEQVLEEAVMAGDELLTSLQLPAAEYKITSMEWEGEAFPDEEGQLCRRALAKGQKLVRDYQVLYSGEIWQQKPDFYELTAVYEPGSASVVAIDESAAGVQEVEAQAEAVPEKEPLRYWVRSGFAITVAAGLIGILVGIILLTVSAMRERKRKFSKFSGKLKEKDIVKTHIS